MDKPIKSKPILYTYLLPELQRIAMDHGYNLLVHGSLGRDLDLLCVAWVNEPSDHIEVLDSMSNALSVPKMVDPIGKVDYGHSLMPGGRDCYIIQLNYGYDRMGNHTDDQWYLDIGFTPRGSNDGKS